MNKQWKYTNKSRDRIDQNRKPVIISDEKSAPAFDEFGEPIKRKSRLTTPRSKNTETLISTVPTPGFDEVKINHTPQPRGALARMQEKGLKIRTGVE
jgi:hypothetical protein